MYYPDMTYNFIIIYSIGIYTHKSYQNTSSIMIMTNFKIVIFLIKLLRYFKSHTLMNDVSMSYRGSSLIPTLELIDQG